MDKINSIISHLIAIQNFSKDIHYSCKREAFYSKHLLADRIQDNIYDYIDQIKEVFFLAANKEPLPSAEYLQDAIDVIPIKAIEDKQNFILLNTLILNTLKLIEEMDSLTKGE